MYRFQADERPYPSVIFKLGLGRRVRGLVVSRREIDILKFNN